MLLPPGVFASGNALEEFVSRDPSLRDELVVYRGEITLKGLEGLADRRNEQAALNSIRVRLARSFVDRLWRLCPWLRLAAISGSAAYGRSNPSDDIDFFFVTREDRLWVTLTIAMLLAKFQRMKDRSLPTYCFNRVMDEVECAKAFGTSREPLFAREALSLRVLRGQPYYRSLLQSARWMSDFFPALYRAADLVDGAWSEGGRFRATWRGSIADWIAFACLASYSSILGLWRNATLRESGKQDSMFRTIIRRGLFAYESRKYDLLQASYRRAF